MDAKPVSMETKAQILRTNCDIRKERESEEKMGKRLKESRKKKKKEKRELFAFEFKASAGGKLIRGTTKVEKGKKAKPERDLENRESGKWQPNRKKQHEKEEEEEEEDCVSRNQADIGSLSSETC